MNRSQYQSGKASRSLLLCAWLLCWAPVVEADGGPPGRRAQAPTTEVILPGLRVPLPKLAETAPDALRRAYELANDWAHFDHMQAVHHARLRHIRGARVGVGGGPDEPGDWLSGHLAVARTVNESVLAALDGVERAAGEALVEAAYLRAEIARRSVEYAFMQAALALDSDFAAGRDTSRAERAMESARYGQAIALWERLVRDFPEHEQLPYTLYQLAYYRHQEGDDAAARHALRLLLCPGQSESPSYPTCQPLAGRAHARALAVNAWMLLGEIHFDTVNELRSAAFAYQRAAHGLWSPIQVGAIYKRAWSLYRMDDYAGAIAAFDQIVALAGGHGAGSSPTDERANETVRSARSLRPEAVQYLAIAWTDVWQLEDAAAGMSPARRVQRFYRGRARAGDERDVCEVLGDTLADMLAMPQAIEAWQRALVLDPGHARARRLRTLIDEARQRK